MPVGSSGELSDSADRPLITEWLDLFHNSIDARTTMQFAERVGCTFSEAEHRLRPEDVVAELAWIRYQAEHALGRCPQCGTRNDEMTDEQGRIAEQSLWKVVKHSCIVCDIRGGLAKDLEDSGASTDGVRFVPEPRGPGDPLHPDLHGRG